MHSPPVGMEMGRWQTQWSETVEKAAVGLQSAAEKLTAALLEHKCVLHYDPQGDYFYWMPPAGVPGIPDHLKLSALLNVSGSRFAELTAQCQQLDAHILRSTTLALPMCVEYANVSGVAKTWDWLAHWDRRRRQSPGAFLCTRNYLTDAAQPQRWYTDAPVCKDAAITAIQF